MPSEPCPKCLEERKLCSDFVRAGVYYRTSDEKTVQRFRCRRCRFTVSLATFDLCVRQKKRQINDMLALLLSSGVSLRRASLILKVHRKTIERKLQFLGIVSEFRLRDGNLSKQKALQVEFDDLETFEHTKFKPLSITLAVEFKTRRILGIEVARMSAKGSLAQRAREKYGRRKDDRRAGRERFFKRLSPIVQEDALFRSDSNPYYGRDLRKFFPIAKHEKIVGVRGAVTGQGELKKTGFDPIFSVNHTCAMLRANINRLFRRTWCTTKKPENLYAHLMIYAAFHNERLISQA
jgi:transposase-like protein